MPEKPVIAILERNRGAAMRMSRVIAGSAGGIPVICEDSSEALIQQITTEPAFIGCHEADLHIAKDWLRNRFPHTKVVVWTDHSSDSLIQQAMQEPRIVSILGWPAFKSMPRPWELAFVTRRLVSGESVCPRLSELMLWGATAVKWRPRTSADRDRVVTQIGPIAERMGVGKRVAGRLSEVAHELLMNAMYDAPVDAHGNIRYALDRRQDVMLEDHEVPTLRMVVDGLQLGLEVTDNFGRLKRKRMLGGILRGLRLSNSPGDQVLDTSHGGAGLGMLKLYNSGTLLMADVVRGRSTKVTWMYDLDVSTREFRSLPTSIHFFTYHQPMRVPVRTI